MMFDKADHELISRMIVLQSYSMLNQLDSGRCEPPFALISRNIKCRCDLQYGGNYQRVVTCAQSSTFFLFLKKLIRKISKMPGQHSANDVGNCSVASAAADGLTRPFGDSTAENLGPSALIWPQWASQVDSSGQQWVVVSNGQCTTHYWPVMCSNGQWPVVASNGQ